MESTNQWSLFSSTSPLYSWAAGNSTSSNWKSGSEKPVQGLVPTRSIETIFTFSLMVIQCAVLHPKFQRSSSARLTRSSLGPVVVGWWLFYPFRIPVLPLRDRSMFTGFFASMVYPEQLVWHRGPCLMDGFAVWRVCCESLNTPTYLQVMVYPLYFPFLDCHKQSTWIEMVLETNGTRKCQVVHAGPSRIVSASTDLATFNFDPRGALLSLGVPYFRGIGLIAGFLHATCTMFVIGSSMEISSAAPVLLTYLVYPVAQTIGIPPNLSELVNPASYPSYFGPFLGFPSLAHFWGKCWNQYDKLAIFLARVLGGSPNIQKACGIMGVFALSGFLREYPLYVLQRDPHPYPRKLFKTLTGSFLFFFVQSIGLILEPSIIPHIPKRLGGAKLWTAFFLLLTSPLSTRDICRPGGMFNQVRPLQDWTWVDVVIPGRFVAGMFACH
ncbi:hypothetical protein MJO29_002092 [Puccinia striiformis f. sp. tritici]|nr:hypothetical protein MJO29_002092 [Puccinia striiformis f. sp. tritici]